MFVAKLCEKSHCPWPIRDLNVIGRAAGCLPGEAGSKLRLPARAKVKAAQRTSEPAVSAMR
jgi:hypothetical protein